MGRGWKNVNPKRTDRPPSDLPPAMHRVYNQIKRYTESQMQKEYANELFQYRVRYRNGFPRRIHYSQKVRQLNHLLVRLASRQVSPQYALRELERMRNL